MLTGALDTPFPITSPCFYTRWLHLNVASWRNNFVVISQRTCRSFRYSRVSNRRGGRNKRGGWQKSPKLVNGEAGKNTAIKNFIETKSSNDYVKISTKKTIRNAKIVYPHEESFVLLLDSPSHATSYFIVIRKQFCAMWKKQCACFTTIE